MSVSRCLFVNRSSQIKHLYNSGRTQVKVLPYNLNQSAVRYFSCAECIHGNRSRLSYADGIGKLNLAAFCQSCRHNIFRGITCCVSGRAVNLGAVLSGKRAAAVARLSAVGIHDNLSACKSAVSVGSADYKASCRIDKEFCFRIYHVLRNNRIKNILFNIFVDLFLAHVRIMLCRKYDRVQSFRSAVLVILYCHLCFSVRAQIRQRTVFSHLSKSAGKFMRHCDRIRHIFLCLI